MEGIFSLLFVLVLGAGSLLVRGALGPWLAPRASRARREAWRAAARHAGLVRLEESPRDLCGSAGDIRVHLSRYQDNEVWGTRIVLSGPRLARGLAVRPEGALSTLRSLRGERGIEIGDEAFDRVARVQGPPALVHALFDRPTRDVCGLLFRGVLRLSPHLSVLVSGRIDDGTLRLEVPEVVRDNRQHASLLGELDSAREGDRDAERSHVARVESLPEVLAAALALARRLEPPTDLASRVADNLRAEPEPVVRERSLGVLAREYPEHPATRTALLAARDDPDARVRLRAGLELGEEGRDVLLALAGGEGAEDAVTARAVAALGARLDSVEATRLLHEALRTRRAQTAGALMETLGRRRSAESVPVLSRVLAVERGELAAAAAEALGMTHDAGAETALVRALGSPSREVRRQAARALGRAGTAAAVPPLKEAESRDSSLAATARQAIAEIQARLTGAEPGQLSLALAEGEKGRLSLADVDPAGRLSLARRDEHREGAATTGKPEAPRAQTTDGDTPCTPRERRRVRE